MDAHDLVGRHSGDAQRIGFAQIALIGEGKLLEIGLVLDGVNVDAGELLRVEAVGNRNQLLELGFDDVELLFGHLHDA